MKIRETKKKLTKIRIKEKKVRNEKLGEITSPVEVAITDDYFIIFGGKFMDNVIRNEVRISNMKTAFVKTYGANVTPAMKEKMQEFIDMYEHENEMLKKALVKLVKAHPLWSKMEGIKGFTPYALGLIMSYIKDIRRFDTSSKLCVYGGVACINGKAISKTNIHEINQYYHDNGKFTGKRTSFGFNTKLSGRLYVIGDSLIRAQGKLYENYVQIKMRIYENIIADPTRTFKATAEDVAKYKASKLTENELAKQQEQNDGVPFKDGTPKGMQEGEYYMMGRKCQSAKIWSHINAKRRILRILLCLLYKEWRTLNGLPVRNPYVQDYLGHNTFITIEEIREYDKKKSKEEVPEHEI
jgi:hypothetical protein